MKFIIASVLLVGLVGCASDDHKTGMEKKVDKIEKKVDKKIKRTKRKAEIEAAKAIL